MKDAVVNDENKIISRSVILRGDKAPGRQSFDGRRKSATKKSGQVSRPRIICVLGPPRSGTSLTAKLISYLGVQLGSEKDMAMRNVHNPKGFFELRSLQEINDKILAHFGYDYAKAGADWNEAPCFPKDWEIMPELDELRAEAEHLCRAEFGDHEIWGWKDPRAVHTLPFWQRLLPPMQYVICIRNPVDVARSLQRFLDCSFERGLFIWAICLRSALTHTAGKRRLLINVESWTTDWRPQLDRLSAFIGRSELARSPAVRAAIAKEIDPTLWHHRSAPESLDGILELYRHVAESEPDSNRDLFREFEPLLQATALEARQADAELAELSSREDERRFEQTCADILAETQPGSRIILVDENCMSPENLPDRDVTPCMERDGCYWGSPADGDEAVREFERLFELGADYIVFVWSAFWWLEYYPELNTRLRHCFPCVLQNERTVLFDLRRKFELHQASM
jgi:hypothetical protein